MEERRPTAASILALGCASLLFVACSLLVDTTDLGSESRDASGPNPADSGGLPADGGGTSSGDASDIVDAASLSKYAATVMADQPLAYWRMGAPVGGVIRDETGRGNDLRAMGLPTGYSVVSPGALKDDNDPGIHLDGDTAWFEALRPRDLDLLGSSLTVEAWARIPAQQVGFEQYQQIVCSSDDQGSARYGYLLYLNTVERTGGFEWSPKGTNNPSAGDYYMPDAWTHFAATYDASANRIIVYFNGLEVDRKTVSAGPLTPRVSAFVVGGDHYPGESVFNGDMDEIAIYPRALTQPDLAKHYLAGLGQQ